MKPEEKAIIDQLPENLQRSFYFGYMMNMADDLGSWDVMLRWFEPHRRISELKSKTRHLEDLINRKEKA